MLALLAASVSLVTGPAVADAAQPMNGTFVCSVPWADIANVPSGYAIGNCRQGTVLHRTSKSAKTPNGFFDGGYIAGSFAGCGWVRTTEDHKLDGAASNACSSSASRPLSSFALATNDGACGGRCTDGTPVENPAECPKYANFRPWSERNRPTDPVGKVDANSNRLLWRYVSRHASADGSGRYVMVHDPDASIGPSNANWVFVPRSCLGTLPGSQSPS
jgi:hypothetical protein